ncbi:DUF2809 domain-containing protein [Inquilinus sp. KBS0705]|nr:DUF2809 domain-containing protein [Inquilinus sp. KBS0705]
MFQFHIKYFFLTILLFITEVYIGVYVHDNYIRPFGGDFLVVILMYCFIKSFTNIRVLTAALVVLVISFIVEGLQYLHLVSLLGLQNSKPARMILGTFFSWTDILVYILGILLVLFIEWINNPRVFNSKPVFKR